MVIPPKYMEVDSMQEPRRSSGSHDAETTRRSRRTAPVESYEPDVRDYKSGAGYVKYILLGLVLLLVVAVLVVLCVRCSRADKPADSVTAANLTSTIVLQDSYGKDLSKDIEVTAGSLLPEGASVADSIALNLAWTGKSTPTYPMIMSITDPAFTDGDGLIVFRNANGQWEKLDTYIVSDHSITFLLDGLGAFAFVPYSKFSTPTPVPTDTPEPTATPSPTPSASPSPTPSASPSPTPSSGGRAYYNTLATPGATTVPTANNPVENEDPIIATEPPAQAPASGGNTVVDVVDETE